MVQENYFSADIVFLILLAYLQSNLLFKKLEQKQMRNFESKLITRY